MLLALAAAAAAATVAEYASTVKTLEGEAPEEERTGGVEEEAGVEAEGRPDDVARATDSLRRGRRCLSCSCCCCCIPPDLLFCSIAKMASALLPRLSPADVLSFLFSLFLLLFSPDDFLRYRKEELAE